MNKTKWSKCTSLIVLFSSFILHSSSSLLAQPPELINYQGRLVNGTNLVNGNVGLSLRLYNVGSGGAVLFEDSNTVSVVDGLYSTMIGDDANTEIASFQPLSEVLTNTAVYVETVVNGIVLSPRERIASVAYALRAGTGPSIQPPIDITYSNFPDSVLRIANNGGGPAIWAEATNASALFGVNWGDGNALFVANAGSGPSAVFQGGNVGVGTQTPGERLSVNGRVYSTFGGFRFPDGSVQETAAAPWLQNEAGDIYYLQGNVGIGADSPSNTLHLSRSYPDSVSTHYQAERILDDAPQKFTNDNTTVGAAGSGVGGAWTAPANILNSDNIRASSTLANNGFEFASQTLVITNLGITGIPTNAFGLSMSVAVEGFHSSAINCGDVSIEGYMQAVSNGIAGFSAVLFYFDTAEQIIDVSSFNGWGMALTPQLVTNPTFGVSLRFAGYYGNCAPSFPTTVFIDQIRVTFRYFVAATNGTLEQYSYVMGIPQGKKNFVINPGGVASNPTATQTDGGIVIQTNGWVGIGTAEPLGTLHVDGQAFKPGGGNWTTASDKRLKENIKPLAGTLEKLLSLHGVTFNYKDPDAIHELHGERIGLLAQEVERVFPDWVEEGPDGFKRLTVRGFEALTVEAMRELKQENDELKQELEAIKQKIGM